MDAVGPPVGRPAARGRALYGPAHAPHRAPLCARARKPQCQPGRYSAPALQRYLSSRRSRHPRPPPHKHTAAASRPPPNPRDAASRPPPSPSAIRCAGSRPSSASSHETPSPLLAPSGSTCVRAAGGRAAGWRAGAAAVVWGRRAGQAGARTQSPCPLPRSSYGPAPRPRSWAGNAPGAAHLEHPADRRRQAAAPLHRRRDRRAQRVDARLGRHEDDLGGTGGRAGGWVGSRSCQGTPGWSLTLDVGRGTKLTAYHGQWRAGARCHLSHAPLPSTHAPLPGPTPSTTHLLHAALANQRLHVAHAARRRLVVEKEPVRLRIRRLACERRVQLG